jgi:hypothetical protein
MKPKKPQKPPARRRSGSATPKTDLLTALDKTILAQTAAMKNLSDANEANVTKFLAAIRDLIRFYDDGVKTTPDHERLLEIRSWIK